MNSVADRPRSKGAHRDAPVDNFAEEDATDEALLELAISKLNGAANSAPSEAETHETAEMKPKPAAKAKGKPKSM